MLKVAMIGAGGYAHQLMNCIWEIPKKIELLGVRSSPKRQSSGTEDCKNRGIPIYREIDEMLDELLKVYIPIEQLLSRAVATKLSPSASSRSWRSLNS